MAQDSGLPTQWSSGLFDCRKDSRTCCLTCWCPCISFGRMAEVVDEGSTSCLVSGLVYVVLLILFGTGGCYSCLYRTKMRSKFNLAKSPCGDCVVHCFCDCCALCQEYRELKYRGLDPAIGWVGNVRRQQEQPMMGMGMPMAAPAGQTMNKP